MTGSSRTRTSRSSTSPKARGAVIPRRAPATVYWEDETYSDRRSLIYFPAGFDLAQAGRHRRLLPRQRRHARARRRRPPAGAPPARRVRAQRACCSRRNSRSTPSNSSSGNFWTPGFFARYLDEASAKMAEVYGDPSPRAVFARMPVVLLAYSGGYNPAVYAAAVGGADRPHPRRHPHRCALCRGGQVRRLDRTEPRPRLLLQRLHEIRRGEQRDAEAAPLRRPASTSPAARRASSRPGRSRFSPPTPTSSTTISSPAPGSTTPSHGCSRGSTATRADVCWPAGKCPSGVKPTTRNAGPPAAGATIVVLPAFGTRRSGQGTPARVAVGRHRPGLRPWRWRSRLTQLHRKPPVSTAVQSVFLRLTASLVPTALRRVGEGAGVSVRVEGIRIEVLAAPFAHFGVALVLRFAIASMNSS